LAGLRQKWKRRPGGWSDRPFDGGTKHGCMAPARI